MSGKRLAVTVGLLAALAVLAVLVIVTGGDDDDDAATPDASTTLPAGPLPDERIAAALLPPVSALGGDWIETQREDAATEAEPSAVEGCPAGPIPEGVLIHSEQQRIGGADVLETLSVTAGVIAEGVAPLDLEDETVVGCLRDGLQAQVPETSTVTVGEDVDLGPPPAGAVVSHVRLEVSGAEGVGGTFDFVLVQRGRLASLGLLTGFDPSVATALADVVTVLDRPLAAVEDSLD